MNSIQASLSNFVGSLQLKAKIDEATSLKDDPTPSKTVITLYITPAFTIADPTIHYLCAVYLLDETVQMIGNKPDNVKAAIDALKARLSHRSPIVKQKTLRLIKHCCQKGSPEFKRAMSRHSYSVKDLTSYKCTPDDFKGDIPWKRVQEAARECLEALHAAPDNNNNNMINNAYQSYLPTSGYENRGGRRMEGFGSGTGVGGPSSSSLSSHGEMTAFGNTPLDPSSSGSNQRSSSLLETFTTGVNSLSNSINRPHHHRLPSTEHQWVNDQPSYGQHPAVLSQPIAALDNTYNNNLTNQHQQSSTPEGALVNKICTPSGLRAVPETADLKAFVAAAAAAAATINITELSQLLDQKCEKGPWQASLRALCAIAALIEGGGEAGGETAVYFQSNPDTVRKMAGHPQATVRQRADRVLKLIGADTLPSSSRDDNKNKNNSTTCDTAADLSDLLFGDDSGSNAAAGVVDLFSGLDISSSTTTQQPSSAAAAPLFPDALFQDPFQQQAPPAPPPSSDIADPFFVEQPGIDLFNMSSAQNPYPMMMGGSNSNGNGSGGMKSMMTGGGGGGGSGGKEGAFNFIESQLNEMKVTKRK